MKVSMVATMSYVAQVPWGWPRSPALYDRAGGRQAFRDGLAQAELADELGFDFVSLYEHHYSNVTVSPCPGVSAAWLAGRLKRASLAIWGPSFPNIKE
jgi:hypothetical protein